jgi:hypothetical protein
VARAVEIQHLVGARTRPLGKDARPFPPGAPPLLITMFIIGSRKAACNQWKQHQMRCNTAGAIRLGYEGLKIGVYRLSRSSLSACHDVESRSNDGKGMFLDR